MLKWKKNSGKTTPQPEYSRNLQSGLDKKYHFTFCYIEMITGWNESWYIDYGCVKWFVLHFLFCMFIIAF